jgi:flavin reductase (DIM6/NTAB) family NADH-FMN oxidoreductase RutF
LNVPHADLAKQVNYCGSVSGRDHDKFKEAGLTPVEAKKVGAPWIAECLGHLECGVVAAHVAGDHTIFVGQVLAAWVESGTFDRVWLVEKKEARLLHHLGGNFFCVPTERIEV